jgi:cell wall-associated NlpC family hydrolase
MDSLLTLHHVDTEQQQATTDLDTARLRVDATRRTLNALAERQRAQQARLAATRTSIEGEIAALRGLRQRAYGNGYRLDDNVDLPAPPYVPGPAGKAVAFAFRQLGKPYLWGADGPNAYDCSGLTSAAWASAGVGLPHNARRQYGSMAHISRTDLRPGDLIFYYGGVSHVAMYIGDGKMIHAPEYGERIRIDSVDFQPVHGYGRPG